jgi:hypothetical protein
LWRGVGPADSVRSISRNGVGQTEALLHIIKRRLQLPRERLRQFRATVQGRGRILK